VVLTTKPKRQGDPVVDWDAVKDRMNSFALPILRGIERLDAFEVGYAGSLP